MHPRHTLLFRLSLVPLLAIVALPFFGKAQAALIPDTLQNATQIRPYANEHRSTYRIERRAFERALERCLDARRDDPTSACPDVNDLESYRNYLAPEWMQDGFIVPQRHTAAPEEVEIGSGTLVPVDSLTRGERVQLRQFTRLGVCPSSLKGTLLYEVCRRELGASATGNLGQALQDYGVYQNREPNRITVQDRLNAIQAIPERTQQSTSRPSVRRLP